jgi:glycosyltransferase involved in cell wall biosynthesis
MIFSYVPDISVILPTFNRADHLQAAIESVIAQSLWNWELIVVDDGSTDNTFSVVNPYTARYENIRYMKHMNR